MLTHADIARAVGGKFFHVVFVKRSDGSRRSMRARLGVRKFLSGGGAKYSFSDKLLLPVWDVTKQAYRSIPLDAILEFRCGNVILSKDGNLGLQASREDYNSQLRARRAERRRRTEERDGVVAG